jgi:hypothetical protein
MSQSAKPDAKPSNAPPAQRDPEAAMRTCPICAKALEERGCKLRCPDPRCGYFLSCADYY